MGYEQSDVHNRLYRRYATLLGRVPSTSVLAAEEYFRGRAPYLRQVVRRHLGEKRAARIVDLGCGDGALLHFAREAGFSNLSGVDGSEEQVELAHRLGITCVQHGALETFLADAPSESVDVVIAFDVLEHLSKSQALDFLEATRRVLRPGGRLLIHVPNAASPFFGHVRYGDFTHQLAFTKESLRQVLQGSGFQTVRCFEDAPVVHGAVSAARFVLWRAVRLALRVAIAAETGDIGRNAVLSQNLLAVAIA